MNGLATKWGRLSAVYPAAYILSAALSLFFAIDGYGQGLELGQNTIDRIDITGLKRVDPSVISSTIKTLEGESLNPERITEDIQRLWRTGLFRNVVVKTKQEKGSQVLVFELTEKQTIRSIRYEGHRKLKIDELEEAASLQPNTMLDLDALKLATNRIQEKAVEKGYYLAEVDYRIEADKNEPDVVDVVLIIRENDKVLVREINLFGNTQISTEELRKIMKTRVGTELSIFGSSGTFRAEALQFDTMLLQFYYNDRGYITAQVSEPTIQLAPDQRSIFISIGITEGEKYEIGDIRFTGDVDWEGNLDSETKTIDEASLKESLDIESGEVISRSRLLANVETLTNIYRDVGFAYANINTGSSPREEDGKFIVDLSFHVQRGNIVSIRFIKMSGNTKTRDKVIRRRMMIEEAQRYSWSKIQRSKANIFRLGFFETVEVVSEQTGDPTLVDLKVEVQEKSTGTFQVGAGFASQQGPIFNAQIREDNFLGHGVLLALNANIATGLFARRFAQLQVFEPHFLDSNWGLSIDGYWTDRLEPGYTRLSRGVSPGVQYPLTQTLRLSAAYTLERQTIRPNSTVGAGPALFNLDIDGLVSSLRTGFSFDTRDNVRFTRKGQLHQFSFEISDPSLGASSELQYRRASWTSRYFHPVGKKLVLRFNTELGYVFGGGPRGVPISERFSVGGIFNRGPRGFAYRRVGPSIQATSDGFPLGGTQEFSIGGNKQFIFNAELEFPILNQAGIKGVLFADAGNAFNEDEGWFYIDTPQDIQRRGFANGNNREIALPLGLYPSVGFGVRWFSPMGPLRFEWGIPLVKRLPSDQNVRFEFAIGNFF